MFSEKTRSANSHSIAVALSISYPVKISRERFYNIPFIQLNNSPYTFTILPIADKAHKKSKQVIEISLLHHFDDMLTLFLF